MPGACLRMPGACLRFLNLKNAWCMLKNVLNVKHCVLPLSVGVYFNAFKVNVILYGSY